MQTPEDDKDVLPVLCWDANAIVRHRRIPFVVSWLCVDLNDRFIRTVKLNRICDQVLKYLRELGAVGHDCG